AARSRSRSSRVSGTTLKAAELRRLSFLGDAAWGKASTTGATVGSSWSSDGQARRAGAREVPPVRRAGAEGYSTRRRGGPAHNDHDRGEPRGDQDGSGRVLVPAQRPPQRRHGERQRIHSLEI